ncbi:putative deoxyuridine 5'apos-triphosphate nucleotidohydrolase [Triplophysa rosa]|uniref:Deoxyuridine 5'-triphosphate nucleotidohydrolase n=1 Tax=Triplophysa rosa TaxID=992332 RepID=A0A9W7WAC7_TRIRA|nr:putative deoxyuridine 5'apos-triphosphate nucleotidohydrolase [Triplophysa rosa]
MELALVILVLVVGQLLLQMMKWFYMTKRASAKYKFDRKIGQSLWGLKKNIVAKRGIGIGEHSKSPHGDVVSLKDSSKNLLVVEALAKNEDIITPDYIEVDWEKKEDVILPEYETSMSSGVDLRSSEDLVIAVDSICLAPTSIALEIPSGFEAQVRSRSGLALKNGVVVLNSPGTIDADYRGEIKVILKNLGNKDFKILKGDRIAQLVFAPVVQIKWDVVEKLDNSERGSGGFGSTGIK